MQDPVELFASLVSNENIDVIYSDCVSTASFDIHDRTITLPMNNSSSVSSDVLFLFSTHECGHALYSKYDVPTFKKYVREFGDLFNIVEDIYIEKKIKQYLPGIVPMYKRAYIELFNDNFFGNLSESDISNIQFIERINLFFKVGHVINVPFNKQESRYIYELYNLNSNKDVVMMCRKISEFIDMKEENFEGASKFESTVESSESETSGINSETQSAVEKDVTSENKNSGATQYRSSTVESSEKYKDNLDSTSYVHTDRYFGVADTIHFDQNDILTNPCRFNKEIEKQMLRSNLATDISNKASKIKKLAAAGDVAFKINLEAKRIKSQRHKLTGHIDTKKLVKYKTAQNIFKKQIITENQQNHAMVILVDYSSSIKQLIEPILMQAAITAEFCQRNEIPYELFLFGANIRYNNSSTSGVVKISDSNTHSVISILRCATKYSYSTTSAVPCVGFGNTPIDRALVVAEERISLFKQFGYDKTHLLVITDGDGTGTNVGIQQGCVSIEKSNRDAIIYKKSKYITKDLYTDVNSAAGHTACAAINLMHVIKQRHGTEITFSFVYDTPLESFFGEFKNKIKGAKKFVNDCKNNSYSGRTANILGIISGCYVDYYDPENTIQILKVTKTAAIDSYVYVNGTRMISEINANNFDGSDIKGIRSFNKSKKLDKILSSYMQHFGATIA